MSVFKDASGAARRTDSAAVGVRIVTAKEALDFYGVY